VVSTLGAKPSPDALSTRDIEVMQTRMISPEATTSKGAMILISLAKVSVPTKAGLEPVHKSAESLKTQNNLASLREQKKKYLQMMPKLFSNSPNATFSILQLHPNTY
jgi:hypothetical protein